MSRTTWLRHEHLDALRELGNIGAGHAATALSELLKEPVRVSVTAATMRSFDEMIGLVGGAEMFVTGVFLPLRGDISGTILLFLSIDSSKQLIRKLLGIVEGEVVFDDLACSVLSEVGNILAGSYTSVLSTMTGLHLAQDVPGVAMDMAGALFDASLSAVGSAADTAVLVDTELYQGDERIRAQFLMIPDPESTPRLLRAFGYSGP